MIRHGPSWRAVGHRLASDRSSRYTDGVSKYCGHMINRRDWCKVCVCSGNLINSRVRVQNPMSESICSFCDSFAVALTGGSTSISEDVGNHSPDHSRWGADWFLRIVITIKWTSYFLVVFSSSAARTWRWWPRSGWRVEDALYPRGNTERLYTVKRPVS